MFCSPSETLGNLRWEYFALYIQQKNRKQDCLNASTNRRPIVFTENVALEKLFIATLLNIQIYITKTMVLAILMLVKVILNSSISINITCRTMEKIKTICFLVDDYNLYTLIIIKILKKIFVLSIYHKQYFHMISYISI